MNNEQLTEPGLISLQQIEEDTFKGILVMNAIDKVKNCPLTKFLKDLNKE